MKVLIVSDLVMEFFLNRSEQVETGERLLELVEAKKWEFYITELCLMKTRFYMGKPDAQFGDEVVSVLEEWFQGRIILIDQLKIEQALTCPPALNFDCAVEGACASIAEVDVIVTENPSCFVGYPHITVLSGDRFLRLYGLEQVYQLEPFQFQEEEKILRKRESCLTGVAINQETDLFTLSAPPGWHPNIYYKYLQHCEIQEYWDPPE